MSPVLLLDAATGQLKLHLLLMLNTGCTQKDISDLRKDQLDLAIGTMKRRRSKTQNNKNTPLVLLSTVAYNTFFVTKAPIQRPGFALVTQSGRRWVRKEMLQNGHLKKSDNIATLFQRLRVKVKLTGSLKLFRKTSTTRLPRLARR
jgi:integrase